jgi:hypothetical protein
MRRVAWYETPLLVVLPLIVVPLLLILAALYRFGRNPVYRRLGFIVAGLGLLYVVCLFLEGEYANWALISDRMWIAFVWRLALQLVLLGLLLWPVLLLMKWRDTRPARSVGGIAAAAHFILLALCSWSLVALAGYWNLLGKF